MSRLGGGLRDEVDADVTGLAVSVQARRSSRDVLVYSQSHMSIHRFIVPSAKLKSMGFFGCRMPRSIPH